MDIQSRLNRLEKHCGLDNGNPAKPEPVDLGEFEGFEWRLDSDFISPSGFPPTLAAFKSAQIAAQMAVNCPYWRGYILARCAAVAHGIPPLAEFWKQLPTFKRDTNGWIWLGRDMGSDLWWKDGVLAGSGMNSSYGPGPLGLSKMGDTEGLRRAALLGLCDAKPAPEKTAETQLREAGAAVTLATNVEVCPPRAYIDKSNDKISVCVDGLTLPRAVAALRAARGVVADCHECPVNEGVDKQLAAKDAEIARLKGEVSLMGTYLAEAAYHVKGVEWLSYADADKRGFFCPECGESREGGHGDACQMGRWLTKTKAVRP